MCALVETAHTCFRVRAGIGSCTSHRLVVKNEPKEWPLLEGRTEQKFPGGPWDWHCETLRRSFQPSSEGARPLWKHVMAPVCIGGPTCSWLERIYYFRKEVCPARSPVFRFSVSEMDDAALVYVCLNRLEDCVSTNPSAGLLALAGIQPIKETGNAAHMSRAFWVVPAGVLLIMIWHSCRLLTRSIPDAEARVQQQHIHPGPQLHLSFQCHQFIKGDVVDHTRFKAPPFF